MKQAFLFAMALAVFLVATSMGCHHFPYMVKTLPADSLKYFDLLHVSIPKQSFKDSTIVLRIKGKDYVFRRLGAPEAPAYVADKDERIFFTAYMRPVALQDTVLLLNAYVQKYDRLGKRTFKSTLIQNVPMPLSNISSFIVSEYHYYQVFPSGDTTYNRYRVY